MARNGRHKRNGRKIPIASDFSTMRLPRKKYVIGFGYLGNGFHGMARQCHPETPPEGESIDRLPTIEGVLAHALKDAELVNPEWNPNQKGALASLGVARCARTDKGVHAGCNFVSLRMSLGPLAKSCGIFDSLSENSECPKGVTMEMDDETLCQWTLLAKSLTPDIITKVFDMFNTKFGPLWISGMADRDGEKVTRQVLWNAGRELDALERLRRRLPVNFQIHTLHRVPRAFDARHYATSRRYEYYIPAWVLAPLRLNVDTHSELDKLLCHNITEAPARYAKKDFQLHERFAQCRRARKVMGTLPLMVPNSVGSIPMEGRPEAGHGSEMRPLWETSSDPRSLMTSEFHEGMATDNELCEPPVESVYFDPNDIDPMVQKLIQRQKGGVIEDALGPFHNLVGFLAERQAFHLTEEDAARFNSIVAAYVGRHDFSNFSSGLKKNGNDPVRTIFEASASLVETSGEQRMLKVVFFGASFVLNQIRKMVAMAIEIFVGSAPSWAIEDALKVGTKRYVHMAPAEGLLLDAACYRSFNEHKANPPVHPPLSSLEEGGFAYQDPIILDDSLVDLNPGVRLLIQQAMDPRAAASESLKTFKKENIYPRMMYDFYASSENENCWHRWLLDVEWHPFTVENFPPMARYPKSCC